MIGTVIIILIKKRHVKYHMCSHTCECFVVLRKENTGSRTNMPGGDATREESVKGSAEVGVGGEQMEKVERQRRYRHWKVDKYMSQRTELSSSLTIDTRKGLDEESGLGSKYLLCCLCTPGV